MMTDFDHIAIIFNPKSTGDAPQMAKELTVAITKSSKIGAKPKLTPTKAAGDAVKLARDIALRYKRPLIISVSGDGGYNEVVNGAMEAKTKTKASPVLAVVAAGNANDHKRVMRGDTPLVRLIEKNQPRSIDLLHVAITAPNFNIERYAHSYIGIGFTSHAGDELNRHGKGRIDEIRGIWRTLRDFEPFVVERDGRKKRYDNMIFANINEMAKVVKLDDKNTVHDGKFELVATRHRGKLRMLLTLVWLAVRGTTPPPSYASYDLTLRGASSVQLDGEIDEIPRYCQVVVKSAPSAIETLY